MGNVRYNVKLTFQGTTACVAEWARKVGVSAATIYQRVKLGWSAEKALTTPPDPRKGKRNDRVSGIR